jgi:hypothetical protein
MKNPRVVPRLVPVILLLTMLCAWHAQAQQPSFLTNGLVAYYPFNGNANDESGNGNNAGQFRTASDRFGGQTAKAYETLNDAQPITVNQEGLFLKQHTFAAWVKFNSDSPAYQTIYNLVSGNAPAQASARLERIFEPASGNYYSLAISRRKWTAGNPATYIDLLQHSRPNPSPVQSNGVWYHIVVVASATTSVIGNSYVYVDGSLVLTSPEYLLTGVSDSSTIRLGGDGINDYANLNGALDDVRIYNRALSDSEVKALYDYESIPQPSNPRTATATAQVVNGFVVGATITDGGSGYTNTPTVNITGGGGSGATARATVLNGTVTSVIILTSGSGYTSAPTINIAPPPFPPRRATGTAQIVNGFVVGGTVTDGGFGYTEPPNVLLIGGGGTGATATATIQNGVVTGITIVNSGTGYTSAPTLSIASPPFAPSVSIRFSKVMVELKVVQGRRYQLESSTNLQTWTPTGPPFVALDEDLQQEFDAEGTGTYFRIQQVP